MPAQHAAMDTVLDIARQAQFGMADVLRRVQGDAYALLGLGASEHPYEIIAATPHWRLRDYGGRGAARSLLIVAAPIKRPYIWDLAPSTSAIRRCLRQGLHVYLLEWMPASRDTSNNGIDECALAISDCVANISSEAGGAKPFLIGHSLGGTLAAIYGASAPETICRLVLLAAPLCFQAEDSQFRDALVSLVPSELPDAEPFPGSLLSHMSAMACPETFIWSRLIDAALSVTDSRAMEVHARVERWTLDEIPLPGRLVHQILDWLYRENRFCRGTLKIGQMLLSPSGLSVPTLAVVNMSDTIAPLASLKPFAEAMPAGNVRIIEYRGEVGVCLQHLGILVGRQAHAQIWPEIIAWLKSRD